MHITAVTTWFPTESAPSRGAFVVRDLHAIAQHHEVRVVHLVPPHDDDGSRRVVHEGIEVLRIPMAPSRPGTVAAAAQALGVALRGAELVHSMAFSSLLPLVLVRPEVPWVHTEHWSALTTPETLSAPARAALPLLTRALRAPDRVTAVCEFLADPIRRVRGTRPTDVVPCIVEPSPLAPRRDRSDGSLRLVSTGGLIDRKDPLIAVRTLADLTERGVDAHLTWLGEGPLRERTRSLADELAVSDRLSLPGNRSGAEVREALGDHDLFFGPTRADNFFVSAAEAIVAGRPVVLGSTGGQGEYTSPEIGELVPVQDPSAYADAIQAVDARTRAMTAERIAATIGDSFSSANVGRAYAETYARAVDSGHTARTGTAGATPPPASRCEVVIACHSTARPLARAVASVLDGNGDVADVTVVAHNIEPSKLAALLPEHHRAQVRILEHHDEHRSASGPFNAGIRAARHGWVSILGSDDQLMPGAVRSWLALQRRTGADFVMTRLALGTPGAVVPTPPVRPLPRSRHDLAADRLSYRSAPLGLMSVRTLDRLGLTLVEGAGVGGDVGFVTRLCAEAHAVYDTSGAPYVIGEDAGDRVTYEVRPIAEQIGFLRPLLEAPWFRALDARSRRSVVVKFLRIHVFGAVHYRPDAHWWSARERGELAARTQELLDSSPGAEGVLSRAEIALLEACLDPGLSAEELIRRSIGRRRHGRPATLLTSRAWHLLSPDAPPRFMAASLLTKVRRW